MMPATCDLVAAANRFITYLPTSNRMLQLHARQSSIKNFSSATFPGLPNVPVLYIFSGVDLLNARSFFPASTAYLLVSNLRVGHADCLCVSSCFRLALANAKAFLASWASFKFARLSTGKMELLAREQDGSRVLGIIPALLLNLALDFDGPAEVVQVDVDSQKGSARPSMIRIQTRRFAVTYRSMLLSLDRIGGDAPQKDYRPNMTAWRAGSAYVDAQLRELEQSIKLSAAIAHEPTHEVAPDEGSSRNSRCSHGVISIIKSAPHWILGTDWMAQWVLDHSVAVLQDETGLRLDHYDAASRKRYTTSWLTSHAGRFPGFWSRERAWYAESEFENLSNTFSGPQLPFQFGYGAAGQNGMLLAAWREGCGRVSVRDTV